MLSDSIDLALNQLPNQFLKQRKIKERKLTLTITSVGYELIRQYGFYRQFADLKYQTKPKIASHDWTSNDLETYWALELYQNDLEENIPVSAEAVEFMDDLEKQHHAESIFFWFIACHFNEIISCNDSTIHRNVGGRNFYGYLAIFCNDIILNQLCKRGVSSLVNEWFIRLHMQTTYKQYSHQQIENIFKHLCTLTKQDLIHMGWSQRTTTNSKGVTILNISLSSAKLQCFIGNYDTAIQMLVILAVSAKSLFKRVNMLRAISDINYEKGQYLLSMKVLRCCYKLCKGYLLPSFVETKYWKKRTLIKEKIKKLTCFNCGKSNEDCGLNMKTCTGCMTATYCSKKCQKFHWNKHHKNQCDGIWTTSEFPFYFLLKQNIFDRL
eukprot:475170_1